MKKRISIVLALAFIIGLIPSIANAKLVACVGDSITYGYGLPDRESNCYPAQLEKVLRQFDPDWQTQNFGANGATLLRSGDQPYIRKSVYNPALLSAPEVVIIMLGSNDSWPSNWVHKDDFITDYLALIDAFAELPSNPKIFICCPPPIWGRPWGLDGTVLKDQIIPLIGEVAELRDVGVIDLHTPLEHSSHLFPDGCHPNTEGARMIAEIVASLILGFRFSPDLNGDGKVDFKDFSVLAQYWCRDDYPFVDHSIDYKDLAVLAEYWLEDFRLVAHWKLDETEGFIAHDSVGDCDAFVLTANPLWRPQDGKLSGALELDGIDDCVSTPFVLNPIDGPFSVFAWIKGGAPGQVVLSQIGGVDWLWADLSEGKLMTSLSAPAGRFAPQPLTSETVITDGDWHRVGFTWDGSNRVLYADGVEVARDTQDELAGSTGGLYIGAAQDREPGSSFSGLIDDVCVYNRAIVP